MACFLLCCCCCCCCRWWWWWEWWSDQLNYWMMRCEQWKVEVCRPWKLIESIEWGANEWMNEWTNERTTASSDWTKQPVIGHESVYVWGRPPVLSKIIHFVPWQVKDCPNRATMQTRTEHKPEQGNEAGKSKYLCTSMIVVDTKWRVTFVNCRSHRLSDYMSARNHNSCTHIHRFIDSNTYVGWPSVLQIGETSVSHWSFRL